MMALFKKYQLAHLLFALCVMFFVAPALAEDLVAIPVLQHRVTDLTQTLSQDQADQLEAKLKAFEQAKGSQIAVLVVPTTQPEDIAQYSIRVADAWKIGRQKISDGVIMIVAKNDHKMRIEVGRGLEGAIPDLYAKRIVTEVMKPKFQQGDFAGGINDGVDKIIGLTNGEALPAPKVTQAASSSFENMLPIALFGGVILGGILRAIFGNFLGGGINGGLIGLLTWVMGGTLFFVLAFGVIAFLFTFLGSSRGGGWGGIPISGGGFGGGGGFGSSDTFSGGGGSFGGGGASGDW